MPLINIGYPCVSLLLGRTTNHDCTLKKASPERLRALIRQNLEDLHAILEHNLEHGWLLFRIGSSVIPFGSHPVNSVKWWREFRKELDAIGSFIRREKMRVSFHPGQYTILNSPHAETVSRAIDEITYSARFLGELGLDFSHKIVIHIGGVYGDKEAAIERFCETIDRLPPDVSHRIVIENDEHHYTPAQVLAISNRCNLPVVFDNLHYSVNPGEGKVKALIQAIFATWKEEDGLPKVHFSSQATNGRTGHHAAEANVQEFRQWIACWDEQGDFDLMLEAKNKDKALKNLEEKL